MLINENLLRNIIQHVLTHKLLKEDNTANSINVNNDLTEEARQLEQAQEKAAEFRTEFVEKFENMSLNHVPQDLEKILCKIIYEVIVISCLFKKNKVILGENVANRGDSKLIEIINNFINRKGKEIGWDPNKISDKDKKKFASTTKEMKTFFLALGLQYHTFFKTNEENDERTGGQIALLYKKQAVKKVLEILQSQKILSSYIDELTKKPEDDLSFSEDPKELEGNQQQTTSKNSVNSNLSSSTDFNNSQKTQWPKTFLKQRTKRTPVETIIRNQEGGQYSTPIEEIFENLFKRNMRWSDQKQEFIMHLVGYGKVLSGDTWQKYSQYILEIKNKLIELIYSLLAKYKKENTKDASKKRFESIQEEILEITNNMFNSMQKGVEEKAKAAGTDRRQRDSAAVDDILKGQRQMKKSQMSSSSNIFKF